MSDAKKSTTETTKSGAGKSQAKAESPAASASSEFMEAQERGYFGEKEAKDGK